MSQSSDLAVLQLLNGINTQLNKDAVISAGFRQHAVAALFSAQQTLRHGLAFSGQRQQLLSTLESILDSASKLVAKGQLADQNQAIQLLTACIRACDTASLLQRAVGWGTQLTDAIRRADAASGSTTAAAQAANGAAASSSPVAPSSAIIQAACAAAAELFVRLQPCIDLPAARREVSSIVPKLLQQLLLLLGNSQLPESCGIAALQLTAAMLRCVPTSLRSAAADLERLLQQIVLRTAASTAGSSVAAAGGQVKQQLLAQAALCAALLPAAPGNGAAWSEACRRLLLSSHDVLDHLLMGLESRPLDSQFRKYLLSAADASGSSQQQQQQQPSAAAGAAAATTAAPANTGAPWLPSLPWHQQQQQQSGDVVHRRQTVPALLLLSCCITGIQQLLQQPFAVPVPLPGYSLALLAARLLRFDAAAAVAAGAVPGSSTMYQELLMVQQQLQVAGWQLLQLVIGSCGWQLQLQGTLLRLVRQGLRALQLLGPAALQAVPVAVRCCVYDTAAELLRVAGLTGVRGCAAEVMGCVVLEVYGQTAAAAGVAGAAAGGSSQQRPAKRSKKSGGSGGDLGQFDPVAAAATAMAGAAADPAARLATAADLPAQVAALRLLQQLVEAGGQLLPADVRAHADAVAYHIGQTAAEAALCLLQQPSLSSAASAVNNGRGGCGGLQGLWVAAYQALLASVLVPCSHRPPFLSQAVTLFRQGRSSRSPAVAAVCQAAAVQCEVLLHPRATAMSSVRQHAGMDAVPPLTKPLFWSALQPEDPSSAAAAAAGGGGNAGNALAAGADALGAAAGTAAAVVAAAAAGVGTGADARAASGSTLDQAGIRAIIANQLPAGPALLPNDLGGAVVMGFPVNAGRPTSGQEQQQQQQQQQLVVGPAQRSSMQQAAPAPAVPPAGRGLGSVPSFGAGHHQQEQLQQLEEAEAMEEEQEVQAGGLATAEPQQPVAGAGRLAATAGPAPAAPAAAAAGVTPGGTRPTGGTPAAALFEEESSDSEGPLPDIDSGSDSSSSEGGEEGDDE